MKEEDLLSNTFFLATLAPQAAGKSEIWSSKSDHNNIIIARELFSNVLHAKVRSHVAVHTG